MGKHEDLSGKVFNRWTVIERAVGNEKGTALWKCLCACGKEKLVRSSYLRNGLSKSCGCYNNDIKVYGVGIFGYGKYKARIGGKITKEYTSWTNMLQRCYSEKYHIKTPTYVGCSVCEEWLNFQNYAEWCNQQPNFGKRGFAVDKDLTLVGNKVYSPEYCHILPREVNSLILDSLKHNKDLPVGVTLNVCYRNSKVKYYYAHCGTGDGKLFKIGKYLCPTEAHRAYIEFKKKVVIKVIEENREHLTETIISNLLNYDFSRTSL